MLWLGVDLCACFGCVLSFTVCDECQWGVQCVSGVCCEVLFRSYVFFASIFCGMLPCGELCLELFRYEGVCRGMRLNPCFVCGGEGGWCGWGCVCVGHLYLCFLWYIVL